MPVAFACIHRRTPRSAVAFLFVAGVIALPATAAAQPAERLSGPQVAEDLRVLRVALETVHPGYLRYATKRQLDTAWARLERRVSGGTTDTALYREAALLLALIRCGHTKAEFPSAIAKYRDTAATFLPFRFRLVQGRMQLLTAIPGAPRGSVVTSINGVSVDSVLTRLRPFTSIDGFTDHARDALLADDSDLLGSAFDHYYPVVFGTPSSWRFGMETVGRAPRRFDVTASPLRVGEWQRLGGALVPRHAEFGATTWRMLDATTVLLTVPSFVNYRKPLDADSVFRGIFMAVRARGARHLVLDVRENSGGSTDAMEALLRYVTHRPLVARRELRQRVLRFGELPRYVSTWGDAKAIFEPDSARFARSDDGGWREVATPAAIEPAAERFTGNVTVLTSAGNASGATMLVALLQQLGTETGKIRLVGDATGGSAEGPTAGQILFVKLPASGIVVRVPVKQTLLPVPFTRGFGVFPDVEVAPRLADVTERGEPVDRALAIARMRPFSARSAAIPKHDGIEALLTGRWRGALEYRDYGTNKLVRIPVDQIYSRTDTDGMLGGWTVYDDGPGKTIVSREFTRIDTRGGVWTEGENSEAVARPDGETGSEAPTRYRMTTSRGPGATTVVLRGSGTDDNAPVDLRYTLRITADSVVRTKEFRRAGGTWEFRHAYRLGRATP